MLGLLAAGHTVEQVTHSYDLSVDAVQTRNRLEPHPVMQRIRIDYDPTEPLTADEWPEESR